MTTTNAMTITLKKIFRKRSLKDFFRHQTTQIQIAWTRFWMHRAGLNRFGRFATRLATWFTPPYYGRRSLAQLNSQGYIAPSANIAHPDVQFGANIFIGDRVTIFQDYEGGSVELDKQVHLYGDSYIQTGYGGTIKIGANTHIQPRCQFSAYKSSIQIGDQVQIAPNCAFYPYDHSFAPDKPIFEQGFDTKGNIVVEDDAWIGYGVIVLSGVRIGKGAVIGAGAVVTKNIPDGAIATGAPARVVKMRNDL